MLSKYFFNAVSRLIASRWVHGYEEHNGHCEDAFYARFGPLHLEVNRCFVLDHDDARVFVQIPVPLRHAQGWQWEKLCVGYVVCRGEEQIRQPGFHTNLQSSLCNRNLAKTAVCPTKDIPF